MNHNQNNHHNPPLNNVSSPEDPITTFQNASGSIPYGMTNDYMFRAVLQSNNKQVKLGQTFSFIFMPLFRQPESWPGLHRGKARYTYRFSGLYPF